ncbi:Ets at 21C [Carabus blaptoides fortunei]
MLTKLAESLAFSSRIVDIDDRSSAGSNRSDISDKCDTKLSDIHLVSDRNSSDSDIATLSTSELLKRLLRNRPKTDNYTCTDQNSKVTAGSIRLRSNSDDSAKIKKKPSVNKEKRAQKKAKSESALDKSRSSCSSDSTRRRDSFLSTAKPTVTHSHNTLSTSDSSLRASTREALLQSVPSSVTNNGSMHNPDNKHLQTTDTSRSSPPSYTESVYGKFPTDDGKLLPVQQQDEDIPVIPQEILYNRTMDYLLAEAERSLCLQSPTSSVQTNDSSELEYTQLQPCRSFTRCDSGESSLPTATGGNESPYGGYSSGENRKTLLDREISVDSEYQTNAERRHLNSPRETDEIEESSEEKENEDDPMVLVPSNPEVWTQSHIQSWLKWSTDKFSLTAEPDWKKFPSTGSELCELNLSDFETRAGNSRSGKLLATHLAHLKYSATGRASSPLNIDCKVEDNDDDDDGSHVVLGCVIQTVIYQSRDGGLTGVKSSGMVLRPSQRGVPHLKVKCHPVTRPHPQPHRAQAVLQLTYGDDSTIYTGE